MSHKRLVKRQYKNNVLITSFVFLILLIAINLGLLITLKAPLVSLLSVNGLYIFSLLFIFKVFESKFLNFLFFLLAVGMATVLASTLI